MSVYEMSAREIYMGYAGGKTAQQLLDEGREEIARRAMLEGGLFEDDAFYAADEILAYAQSIVDEGLEDPNAEP